MNTEQGLLAKAQLVFGKLFSFRFDHENKGIGNCPESAPNVVFTLAIVTRIPAKGQPEKEGFNEGAAVQSCIKFFFAFGAVVSFFYRSCKFTILV